MARCCDRVTAVTWITPTQPSTARSDQLYWLARKAPVARHRAARLTHAGAAAPTRRALRLRSAAVVLVLGQ